ncbi:MAG: acyltransferase family protein [Acidimicrobiales bacterium]
MSDEQPTAPPSVIVVAGQRFTVTAEPASVGAPGQKPGPLAEPGTPPAPAAETAPPAEAAPPAETPPAAPPRHAAPEHAVSETGAPHLDPPMAVTGQYLPALDGLRAFAVAGVLAYHLGFGWASGGYLGVDLFFVLSGFLITSLLLEEWATTARLKLAAFWARRARRLLPALFLVLFAVSAYVVLNGRFGPPGSGALVDLSGLRGDDLATLFYAANWHAIFAHQSYFAQFSAPSPLEHTWSLAIEEQFYLFWPPILLLLLWRARGAWRRVGTVVTVTGALASAALMAWLYHPGTDPTRVYFGTDTRIFDMLAGATIAMVAAARLQPGPRSRTVLHLAAPLAALALGYFWVTAGSTGGLPPGFMFRGGFLVCAVLAAVVIADVRQFHQGPLGTVLSVRPLRWIGMISYGIYLWHWPIFVYMNQARTGLSGAALDLSRVAATLAIAAASYYLVERPIRRRRFKGWVRFALAPAAAALTAGIVVVATIPAVAAPSTPAPTTAAVTPASGTVVPGSGGDTDQVAITLPPGRVLSAQDPLQVMLLGDSVMNVAAPALAAALGATAEATVTDRAIDGFGLANATNWRTSIPTLISQVHPDLILATWSWDDNWALQDPAGYKAELEQAVRLMLAPGDGVAGVVFTQFPPTGPVLAQTQAQAIASDAQRAAGQRAWDQIVRSLPAAFPGRVMYLPVAPSVLLDGKFTTWLPPSTDPDAPRDQWVRVRMIDDVHLCPAGAVRYADAVLADLTPLFHLAPARAGWWDQTWVNDPRYNTPPGSCPDDHPG